MKRTLLSITAILVWLFSAASAQVLQPVDTLFASDNDIQNRDFFGGVDYGTAVAMDGDLLVVGSARAFNRYITSRGETFRNQGAAYAYSLEDGHWVERWKLTPDDENVQFGHFGNIVSMSSNHIGVADEIGTVHIFARVGEDWVRQAALSTGVDPAYRFPAIFGSWAAVGSTGNVVDIYEWQGSEWVLGTRLAVPIHNHCCHALALDGDRLVVSHDNDLAAFERTVSGTWELRQTMAGPGAWTNDLNGDRLIVGGPSEETGSNVSGAARVYAWDGSRWLIEAQLQPDDPLTEGFGHDVAIQDSYALVIGSTPTGGRVWLYERSGTTWSQVDKLIMRCPWRIATSGNRIAVGENCGSGVSWTPRVYTFKINSPTGVAESILPTGFSLHHNYPNPFNPATTISYDLPRAADATLTVYDVLGRTVRELASGTQPAGTYEVTFDAGGLPSGVYFYRLQAGDYFETRRMVVVH